MTTSPIVITKLRDTFSQVEYAGSLEDCLGELALKAGEVLDAACAIVMLTESQVAEIGLRPGTEFGDVLEERVAAGGMPAPVVQSEGFRPASMDTHSPGGMRMFSAIVMQGKVIGVIRASQRQQTRCFSADDLQLFGILSLVITRTIQVIQMQNILQSRFTQLALTRVSDKTIGEIVAESAQSPNQMARILARSFYREMISAGFNFNQIVLAASEVISELTDNMRKHKDAYRRRVAKAGGRESGVSHVGQVDAV